MFRALSDIRDGAFCRGVIGFELWTVFVRSVQKIINFLFLKSNSFKICCKLVYRVLDLSLNRSDLTNG